MAKARKQILYVIRNAADDGYLGPDHLRGNAKEDCRWGHVPFFRAVMAYGDLSSRSKIPAKLESHYLSGTSNFGMGREPTNIEQMCWTYSHTGNRKLLNLAKKTFQFFDREGWVPDCTVAGMLSGRTQQIHGVTWNEFAKLPAILYQCTGDESLLAGSKRYIVARTGDWTNKNYMTYTIIEKATMKEVGRGFLGEPAPTGEIRDRHVAFLGFPDISIGCTSLSAWGNRIYIRSKDYLWCIGDPKVLKSPRELSTIDADFNASFSNGETK